MSGTSAYDLPMTCIEYSRRRAACAESQKQYWSVKGKYRDTIIFFKVGKFYELYEVSLQCTHALKKHVDRADGSEDLRLR